jgi:hypothetical protein
MTNLIEWQGKVYDEDIFNIDLDLSDLAGQQINLVLTVLNNGNSAEDWAFWLLPRIER